MSDRIRAALDNLRRRMEELAAALGDALAPRPELVPVPVSGERDRRRRRE